MNRPSPSAPPAALRRPGLWAQTIPAALLALAWLAVAPAQARAHAVFIFAWAEGDRVCTDSYFSRKNKVRAGRVLMKNPAGDVLQSGTTDQSGGLCFPRPAEPQDLIFVIEAGEGHQAEFRLRAEDQSPVPPSPAVTSAASKPSPAPASPPPTAASPEADENLRRIVREELQSQLGPLQRALAESRREPEPGSREIVGGLGWVAGIFGLAFWLTARRKK